MKELKASIFSLILILSLWSCAEQPKKNLYIKGGKEYGAVSGTFRSRWWNYYKRGLSFLEGEFHAEAIVDLQSAIQKRDKDQRMARTYGMHFIDYFPHRELGIAYYETRDFEAAKQELELSISQFPTAKARFYLDRVRKGVIEQLIKEVTPPVLTLSFKTHEIWTNEDPVIVSGTAEDEHFVATIAIRGTPLFLDGSQKRVSFREPLDLSQGLHPIDVVAKNLAGKATERRILIHVDREGPIITLEEAGFEKKDPKKGIIIKGFVSDEAGVSDLTINGRPIPISKGVEIPFVHILEPHDKGIELKAQDQLGNQTTASLPLPTPSALHTPVLLACADSGIADYLLTGLFDPKDNRPPDIKLKGWDDAQTVFLEKVYIEGQVHDESTIAGLTINQTPVLRRQGRYIFFSHMAELKEGENTIVIQAKDEYGNTASKKFTVVRKIPKALQLAERLSLTSFPFEEKGAISEAGLAFQDNLISALVNRNRFRVVERNRLDVILEEQKLSRTKLIDRGTALKLGRLIAAHSVITGSIVETRKGIEVIAWLIDTETSDILASEDVYGEAKDLPALIALAEGMAIKFHREFPLLDGAIIQREDKHIFTNLGQNEIKVHRRLIVYREKPLKHPVTGKEFGADNEIIGRARVTQVSPEMSKAELADTKVRLINHTDKVITQ